jgi:PAS domain S-box-containing protein
MPGPLRVLLVEDCPSDAELVLRELSRAGFSPKWQRVDTERDFAASLHPDLDIILSDFEMPGFSGLRALEVIQELGFEIPFILISGTIGEETAVDAMKKGAADYFLKDRLARLGPAVTLALKQSVARRERLLAATALRESEDRFRRLAENIQDVFWMTDLNKHQMLYISPAYERIWGRPSAELAVSPLAWLETIHPDDQAHVLAAAVNQAAGTYDEEYRIIRPDGSLRWIRDRAFPVHDDAGQVDRVVGVARDVTASKQAGDALRLFRSLVDHSNDAFEVIDPESGRFVDVNQKACVDRGYTREEYLALHVHDVDPAVTRENWPWWMNRIRLAGSINMDGRHQRKDGTTFPVEVSAKWVHLDNDYIVTVVRDITNRKRNEERFRRLVDSNAQGVMFRNTSGRILDANDAFLRIIGYSREELDAGLLNWIALTPEEFAPLDRNCLAELTDKGVSTPYEKEYIRKDGSRVPVLVGAAAFEYNPQEGVCFVVDLTEFKKLEQQFLRAQRMESIGTLAGGIAHDLNNVLTPIIMALDLMKLRFTDPASAELLSIIGASAQRGADMVRQVLSFGRGMEGRRLDVQINHLLQEVGKISQNTFLKSISVEITAPPDLWTVTGDPTQLHQALLNLCVNARDAMPHGGTLSLSAENLTLDAHDAGMHLASHPGRYVLTRVRDTGSGMPRHVLDMIFDPFFTTKEIGKGTGLGLSTTQAIIKSHDGFIEVHSEVGKGTLFSIYLPVRAGSSGTSVHTPAELPRGNGELVLVIDDEASVRQITRQTLDNFGYRVLLAADGAEAAATYADHLQEIAIVLTDMMMPIMDGTATIHVLKRINPAVRIIAASGLSAGHQAGDPTRLGIHGFLPKPYTAETLLRTLEAALKAPTPGETT